MKSVWSTHWSAACLMALLIAIGIGIPATSTTAQDADQDKGNDKEVPTRVSRTLAPADGYTPVEMFSAIEDELIEVELIGKDETEANIFVTNKSDKALAVQMPKAFAGVPVDNNGVLAQGFGGGGFGGGGRGGFGGGQGGFGGGQGGFGGGGQGFGGGFGGGQGGGGFGGGGRGGFGGGGFGGGGGGLGGGAFNVPPGKRAKVEVSTVCLEFNKEDPRPSMKYVIKPIEDYVSDEAVIEMLIMLANDEVTQPIVQAAAWHRMDGLSFEFLARHNRRELSNGYFERYFAPAHIHWGQRLVPFAENRARMRNLAEESDDPESWRTETTNFGTFDSSENSDK